MKNIKVIQELHDMGITGYKEVSYNPGYQELYKAEVSTNRKGFEKGAEGGFELQEVSPSIWIGHKLECSYSNK